MSDHLWEKHLITKWGKVLGPAAHREWKCSLSSSYHLDSPSHQIGGHPLGFDKIISLIRSVSSVFLNDDDNKRKRYAASSLPLDATMSFYLSLETGRFWFPAQVYNREVKNHFTNIVTYSIQSFFLDLIIKVVVTFWCKSRMGM